MHAGTHRGFHAKCLLKLVDLRENEITTQFSWNSPVIDFVRIGLFLLYSCFKVQADECSGYVRRYSAIRARLEGYFTVCLVKLLESVHGFAKREPEHCIQITARNCRKMKLTGSAECNNRSPRLKYPDVFVLQLTGLGVLLVITFNYISLAELTTLCWMVTLINDWKGHCRNYRALLKYFRFGAGTPFPIGLYDRDSRVASDRVGLGPTKDTPSTKSQRMVEIYLN